MRPRQFYPVKSYPVVLTPSKPGSRRAQASLPVALPLVPSPSPSPCLSPCPVLACLALNLNLNMPALPCLASPGVPLMCVPPCGRWAVSTSDRSPLLVKFHVCLPNERTTELPVPIKADMLSSLLPAVWPIFSPLTEPVQNKWFRSWTYWVAQAVDILSPLACPGAASRCE
ncbi:hypothetical protein B0J13DRAFT_87295 [Dactylonectria estremocensis]|uniref:Uncharacterized protein n=1 Tax=Dactylonectria estremocensis TaxID=1079267 RepID=A0A9P9EC27_9HYPO|nr:hypothetical protein B0J13DRAFT_87295 [Dactylonectria estremocensis]